MDPIIISGLIGGAATLVATVLGRWIHFRLVNSTNQNGEKKKSDIQGNWLTDWYSENGMEIITNCSLIITLKPGDRIEADGVGKDSSYLLEGFDSPYALSFAYKGKDKNRENLVGVVILNKTLTNEELKGHWFQLVPESNSLENGTTTWKKV